MSEPILQVENLSVMFPGPDGNSMTVLEDISFSIGKGEVLGIVGESGCGKSLTAAAIMRLLPGAARISSGRILWRGQDLLDLSEGQMRRIRGNEIAMIFQEPMTSLNPVFTVGDQIREAVMMHQKLGRRAAHMRCIEALNTVGIPSAEKRVDDYPHQMSGGMRQRVMIAMALSCNPALLVADEPTTALDVTIQAQILELLADLQAEFGMAIMMITHDLGVIAEFSHRVNVMYAGRVIESADTTALFDAPEHPYTRGLMRSIPQVDTDIDRLEAIPGSVPQPADWPKGCKFQGRCPQAEQICVNPPPLHLAGHAHWSLCHRPWDIAR
jgi:oligopeptide/dipeptide ABC transporter ATP-binding protein